MPSRSGPRSAAQTPAPPSERIKGSARNPPGSAASGKSGAGIAISDAVEKVLRSKVQGHNSQYPTKKVDLGTLKAVFRRGAGAFSSSHRPTISGGKPNSRTAWAYARVNAFLRKKAGKGAKAAYVQDDDLMELGGEIELLAPNGKPSNLTPEQYRMVRTPQFKAWFGDWEHDPENASKVVDENGEPLVVYHGTSTEFYTFQIGVTGGLFFTNREQSARRFSEGDLKRQGPNNIVLPVFLNARKVLSERDVDEKLINEYYKDYFNERPYITKKSQKNILSRKDKFFAYELVPFGIVNKNPLNYVSRFGYDGLKFSAANDSTTFVVFISNQIKLADGTNTTFDPGNPDIRYETGGEVKLLAPNGKPSNLTPEQYRMVRTPQFKAWFGDWETAYKTGDYQRVSKLIDNKGEPLVLYQGQPYYKYPEGKYAYEADNNGIFFFYKKRLAQTYGNEIAVFIRCESPKDIRAYKTYNDKKISTKDRNNVQSEGIDALYNSDHKLVEFYNHVIDKYAKINEPYVIEYSGKIISIDSKESLMDIVIPQGSNGYRYVNFKLKSLVWNLVAKYMRDSNYDGLIYTDETLFSDDRGDALVVYDSNQIKLADGTNTTFDPGNPDIRYENGGEVKLLAPNGKPSNLTPEQYRMVRTPQFKAWFGDWEHDPANASKVVDENGEPLVVYHGTTADFYIFRFGEFGFHFGNLAQAEKRIARFRILRMKYRIIPCFINLRNPVKTKDLCNWETRDVTDELLLKKIISKSEAKRYGNKMRQSIIDLLLQKNIDGIKYPNEYEGEGYSYSVFRPTQIKLADGTNTTFDPGNPDIRYEHGGEVSDDYILQAADKIANALVQSGYDVKTGAYAKTAYGHSKYLYANYENRSMDNSGNGIKIRVSDHSTSNPYRMSEEVHVLPKKDNMQQIIDKAVKDVDIRLRKELFEPKEQTKRVEDILVVGENEIDPETDEILAYEGISKRGGKKYRIKRSLEKSYVTWEYKDSRSMHFEDGGEVKLLAPNGKPSNLTPEQYRMVRTPQFKAWFGDWEDDPDNASKVVDENGEPLVVYHGSPINKITTFDIKEGSKLLSKMQLLFGTHFASNIDDATIYTKGKGKIYEVFLNFSNPINLSKGYVSKENKQFKLHYELVKELRLDKKFKNVFDYELFTETGDYGGKSNVIQKIFISQLQLDKYPPKKVKEALQKVGFDGVIYTPYKPTSMFNYTEYSKSFIALKQNSIKLADGTNTTFDPENPDIRYEDGGISADYPQPPSNKGDYIPEPAYHEVIYGFYTNPDGSQKSSRFVPYEGPLPPVGTWRISKSASLDGHEIDYLTRIPLDTLVTKELDELGRLDPAKRGDDERYADWIRQGYRSIPIEVVQHEDGRLIITDGHRRYLAHKLAGEKDIEAWVSYTVQSPRNTPVGLTHELAHPETKEMEPEKQIMLPDTQASYDGLQRVLAMQGYELRRNEVPVGRLAKGMTLADIAERHGMTEDELRPELSKGIETEMEHTEDPAVAEAIAMDHLYESPVYYTKLQAMETKNYARGGQIDPDSPAVKQYFAGGTGATGGVLVGKRHKEGGIKAINRATGQPIEMEGGEVVITRDAVSDETKREFEGEMLTNREILSRINESGGGVSFEDGGHVCNCTGRKYKYGGDVMEDYDIIRTMARSGISASAEKARKERLQSIERQVSEGAPYVGTHTPEERWMLHEFKTGKRVVPVDRSRVELFDGLLDASLIYFTRSADSTCEDARLTPKGMRYVQGNHVQNFARGGKTDCGCGMMKRGGETDSEETYFKGINHPYKNQFVLNKAIEEFINPAEPIKKGGLYTPEERNFIAQYSGYGGLIKYGATGKGILYEYYTPTEIVRKMWALAYKYGYSGGKVLEPAIGTGEFVKFAPSPRHVTGYEINTYSAEICRILYPGCNVMAVPFETTFIRKNKSVMDDVSAVPKYELVIGNPPYGSLKEGGSYYLGMGEKKYTRAMNWMDYFIFRGLDSLKPGGLLIYIVGAVATPWLSQDTIVKRSIAQKAILIDAYRLPNGLFDNTEVQTDIIVLKKR